MRIATSRRAFAATGLAILAITSSVTTAQAAPTPQPTLRTAGCPGDGKIGPGAACTSLSSGALFHYKFDNGTKYEVVSYYQKVSGGQISGQLGYTYKGRDSWGSKFTQTAGTRKTSTWHPDGVTTCSPTIGLLRVDGQGTFQTPLAHC
ncbi:MULTISPECIES: hypothetical protein [Streptomyces]|uniref:hypothetical protein n=1 Tax=Streptomyces TaxID=1883 RepID=UPI0033D754F2